MKIVNQPSDKLFDFFTNFNNIKLIFDHVYEIKEIDKQAQTQIGKKYLEFTRNFLGYKDQVGVELVIFKQGCFLEYQTDHWFFKHSVSLQFESKGSDITELTISFNIKKNQWITRVPTITNTLRKRLLFALNRLDYKS